jgi:hypothetical protein
VVCQHTQPAVQIWLMKAMAAFAGDTGSYPNTRNISASAVATRSTAQSTCPVPLGIRPKAGGIAPNYGYAVGEWVVLLTKTNTPGAQFGWMNLDGSNSASETEAEMNGRCGTRTGDTLGTPGVQASIADAWNSRFGIYKNNSGPSQPNRTPDFSGYSYTAKNWPAQANAYNGAANGAVQNFVTQRAGYTACAASVNACETVTGLKLGGGFNKQASPGPTGEFHNYGSNRRIVAVPVVDAGNHVIDFVCMFMLQPIPIPVDDIRLEFRGNAGAVGSPCTPVGLAGGTAGPLVPVLVR